MLCISDRSSSISHLNKVRGYSCSCVFLHHYLLEIETPSKMLSSKITLALEEQLYLKDSKISLSLWYSIIYLFETITAPIQMWAFKGPQLTGGTAVMASSSPFLLHLQEVTRRFKQAGKKATWEEPCNMLQWRHISTYWWKSSFLCTIRIPGKTQEKQLHLLRSFSNATLHSLMILRVSNTVPDDLQWCGNPYKLA